MSDRFWNTLVRYFTLIALPKYLSDNIERVQRRVTSIIFPGLSYSERLDKANLTLQSDRRRHACSKLYNQITKDPAHKLSNLFPARPPITNDLRSIRVFQTPVIKTDRFLKTFIPSCIK